MISFFKKSTEKENLCVGLTDANDCQFVSELRQLQKELEEVDDKIKKLQHIESIDLVEFMKFFLSRELDYIDRSFRWSNERYLSMMDIQSIQYALHHIDDFDKFVDEIRVMYDNEHLIAKEQAKAATLRNKIAEIKNTLGIK